MPYENSDDAERYSDHEERERTEDPEREEPDEDLEREAQEAAENQERREAAERLANKASDELDEMESKDSGDNDFEKNDFNDDLGHDLDEVRDDLHDRYVNDMERQLEGASTKEGEGDETDSDGSSSEMTESSESYHDAGDGMAYAMRTQGGSGEAEAAETEAEEEAQEVSEPDSQESAEQQAESEETEEPVYEKGVNRIHRNESEEGETATSYESQETHEYNDARTSPEVSEAEEETQEVSESHAEAEPAVSNEDQHDTSEPSESMEDTDEGEITETSEPDAELEDLEQEVDEILDSIEESESHEEQEVEEETAEHDESGNEMSTDAERKHEDTTSGHETPEQEMSEEPEVETEETEANEVPAEDEPLPEDMEDFVKLVKEILDEKMDADEDYDLVQDPMTGEMQRVPKILSEYETEEQKQRRKRRNLFAELSEEERERFKEMVREDERSAEDVEKAWNKVVDKAEQEREELLEKVRQVLEDPDVMQLLESMSEVDKGTRTDIELAEDDEMDEEDSLEQFLTQGESRLRVWIPEVNGEKIESVERLEEIVRERFPGLLKHKDYPKYIRQARLHLELLERFQKEELKRGDMARIAKETRESPTTIKRWLVEGAKPRVYHYLTRNPLGDREKRVAKLLSSLNGVTDMESLERRLRTFFLYAAMEQSKTHARDIERARLFFQFLDEYTNGGILKDVAKRLGIGKSSVWEWFNGSQLPSYVRMAAEIPNIQPDNGKKWLPLRLNTRSNLPEQFIQVPDTVTSKEDLLFVLQQLTSLHTPEMKKFEEKYGRESKALAFMYLLGIIVSDGGFDSDSDLSARVVLYASKKYQWSLRLGRAFSYAMGKVGMTVERRADNTKIRDSKVIECNVWASQASPILRWVKEVLFGLNRAHSKKEKSMDAEWILRMPHDYRVAFLQGLADGDGYASIKAFRVGIATKTNQEFIKRLLSTLEIQSKVEKTKVVIKNHEDILKAINFPLFRHATSRKRNHDELCKIIGLLDRSRGKVPERDIKIIMDLHKRGYSCGEITENLWFDYGIARSRNSVEGIVKRRKKFD